MLNFLDNFNWMPPWILAAVLAVCFIVLFLMQFFARRKRGESSEEIAAQKEKAEKDVAAKKREAKEVKEGLITKGFRRRPGLMLLLVAAFIAAAFPMFNRLWTYWSPPPQEVAFSDFQQYLVEDQIRQISVGLLDDGNRKIVAEHATGHFLQTVGTSSQVDAVLGRIDEHNYERVKNGAPSWPRVRVAESAGGFWKFLISLAPWLIFIGIWIFLFLPRMRIGGAGIGNPLSPNKRAGRSSKSDKRFSDVAGLDEPKEELLEIIEFLKNPEKFQALHARMPRGLLLVGPPGCGKTLLAKAVAGEAGVPFFEISGSEFVEVFVGVGASRVRDLLDQAKKNAPCLVFIDEIDAVGRHRGAGLGGGHDEREQTLNQLLVEMDGFDPNAGIIVIAATNRPDILDPALLRQGRFDRRIIVDNPDSRGRKEILQVHLRGIPLAADINVDALVKQTPGFSGADLAGVVNEGALLAARRNKQEVGMDEFSEAVERVIGGPLRKSRKLVEKERKLVAYHEGGHAILRILLPHADPPQKVTIISRGMALGYVMGAPPEDRNMRTKAELLDEMCVAMGGRAAEELVFGDITTGAANDFEQATNMARKMITNFGMSDKLGRVTLDKSDGSVFLGRDLVQSRNYSEAIAYQIDQEVRRITDEAYVHAWQTIEANRDKLERVAQALLERETLYADELEKIMNG